jgi:hypothetical protein
MRPFFGQVCMLYRSEIGVLCGVGQDCMDLYYIIRPKGRGPDVWYSAVGHCESLQPHLPKEMYDGMLRLFELNGGLPEKFVMLLDEGDGVQVDFTEEGLKKIHDAQRKRIEARIAENASGDLGFDVSDFFDPGKANL